MALTTPFPRLRAVIFDCDGVLFDSRQANTLFYNHLLVHFGLDPMGEASVAYVHAHTADASIAHIFEGTGFVEEAKAYRLTLDYTPFIRAMIPEPGVLPLLGALSASYALAVATNRSNTIQDVLRLHGMDGFFRMVVSSWDVTHPKPHPEGILKILDGFGLEKQEAVYVGDSGVDEQTAKAAGVPLIAYRNRGLDTPYHVEQMGEIPKTLEAIERGAEALT